jgi:hypothetical protein
MFLSSYPASWDEVPAQLLSTFLSLFCGVKIVSNYGHRGPIHTWTPWIKCLYTSFTERMFL